MYDGFTGLLEIDIKEKIDLRSYKITFTLNKGRLTCSPWGIDAIFNID
jgi:hypothetical protein